MSKHLSDSTVFSERCASLKMIGKIILRTIYTGMIVALGFWLLMMSNMGPAYLPNVCNGCLDMWIRMTLLIAGISLWILVIMWCIWHLLRIVYGWIKHHQ